MAYDPETRIGAARDRAAAAKIVLGGLAVGTFGFVLAAARLSHPATAGAAATTSDAVQPAAVQDQGDDSYGGGSIQPYQQDFGGPSAQSGTS